MEFQLLLHLEMKSKRLLGEVARTLTTEYSTERCGGETLENIKIHIDFCGYIIYNNNVDTKSEVMK